MTRTKLLIIISIMLVIAAGVVVAWFVRRPVSQSQETVQSGAGTSLQTVGGQGSEEAIPSLEEEERFFDDRVSADALAEDGRVTTPPSTDATFTPDPVTPPTPEDSLADPDNDGLTNEQERQRETDINKSDTDEDGLTDGDEVRVRRTDPLNPDTDGDSFTDGTEVKGGYNPLGEGRLP